jgi:hypothetical protein
MLRPLAAPVVRSLACAAATLLLAAGAAAGGEPTSRFEVEGWQGGAYKDDATGRFSHCGINAAFANGVHVAFMIDAAYRLQLTLGNQGWDLGDGQPYQVQIQVDDEPLGSYPARSRERWFLDIAIGNDGHAYDRLKWGTGLLVRGAREDFRFELAGTHFALSRVKQCVDEAVLAPDRPRNPFAPEGTNPFAPGPGGAAQSLDAEALARLLEAAGETDARIFPGDALGFPDVPLAWTSGGTIGMIDRFAAEGMSLDDAAGALAAAVVTGCEGDVASGARASTQVGPWQFKESFVSCASEGTTAHIIMTTVTDGTSILVVLYMADEYRLERARDSMARLRAVLGEIAARQ